MNKSPLVNNISYIISNPNDTIQKTLADGVQWNKWCYNLLKKLQQEYQLKHLLNIGSHIGSISLPSSLFFEQVSCVEPFPPTYELLCNNVTFNNLSNVKTYNFALGNKTDLVHFLDHNSERLSNNSGGMHCLTNDDIKNSRKSSHLLSTEYESKMYKLDDTEIGNFDIVVIDAEGTEYDLLLGAKSKIQTYKPIIITEIWNNNKRKEENLSSSREDVFDLLESLGYRYESFGKERKNDFCFLPK